MSDKTVINLRIDADVKDALRALAEDDRRNMTQQIEWLVLEELRRRGQKEPRS